MTVRIVTDSTCDLPRELVEEFGITVVPLTVIVGETSFQDGVTITAPEFYARLRGSSVLPRTSQPSVEAFQSAYRSAAAEGAEIVSIHISSRLSGTLNSASVARETLKHDLHVDLIDSYNVSVGLGLIVLEAARAAARGAALPEVVATARRAMDRVSVYVAVDTLEYLQRGGRIGRARSLLGSLLSIKPILTVQDGEVAPFERVRTRARAHERILEIASGMPRAKDLFIAHSDLPDLAESAAARLAPSLPHTAIRTAWLGPVVGTYTGPGCLGFATLERE
ncbi:DegV family protein [Tepidiforma sp.]|uniref:DegV family protein n=1 Tax=Tepidiforma sp. TaxID=2682230 RepID=UPI002ADDBC52|nr:DegV family protein [Tepidiforma sp.]